MGADEQREHFKILFEVLGLLKPEMKGALQHLSYGMVNLTSGRMKSREGTVVDADNLLDEVQALGIEATRQKLAKAQSAEKDIDDDTEDVPEDEIIARGNCIGLAALKFYILNSPPDSTMLYSPQQSIKFEGQTGPYILYCYARTRSVLQKSGDDALELLHGDLACLSLLGTTFEEKVLLRLLLSFNGKLASAAENLNPAKVTKAVFDLAQAFNKFFNLKDKHPIVDCADVQLRRARLIMTVTVGCALKKGLQLLGIETLERM